MTGDETVPGTPDRSPASLAVIGGTGRLGGTVADVAGAAGWDVVVVGRRAPAAVRHSFRRASLTDTSATLAAVRDVRAVVVAVESDARAAGANGARAVHADGVRRLAEGLPETTHLVLVTQIYMTRPEMFPAAAETIAARRIGESAVGLREGPGTIVRPAWLTDDPASSVRVEQGDRGDGQVSRADVAHVVLACLADPGTAAGLTFEVYTDPRGTPVGRVGETLSTLQRPAGARDRGAHAHG